MEQHEMLHLVRVMARDSFHELVEIHGRWVRSNLKMVLAILGEDSNEITDEKLKKARLYIKNTIKLYPPET